VERKNVERIRKLANKNELRRKTFYDRRRKCNFSLRLSERRLSNLNYAVFKVKSQGDP
jgi:hypothetical protein